MKMTEEKLIKVSIVCLGNICRSPAAQALLEKACKEQGLTHLYVESSGVSRWNLGEPCDARMQKALLKKGVVPKSLAREFQREMFDWLDYVLAVDDSIISALQSMTNDPLAQKKVHKLTSFSKKYPNQDIPDPYFGANQGFDFVLDMVEDSIDGFIDHLKKA